jgi:hypothetical protein
MSALDRFPGAPASAYVCEEGWLVIGQQAWTETEWNGEQGNAYRSEQARQRTPAGRARAAARIRRWKQRHPGYRRHRAGGAMTPTLRRSVAWGRAPAGGAAETGGDSVSQPVRVPANGGLPR